MRHLVVSMLLALGSALPTSAEPQWQPEAAAPGMIAETRVVGDVEMRLGPAGGLRVSGWIVDGFSATRPDDVQLRDAAGTLLAEVGSGGFVRRFDVESRFGSSAYALSGFELSIAQPPSTVVVRAHLGQLGWWQTTLEAPVARTARLTRLECVEPDSVELEVTSADPFPVRDALTELEVGSVLSTVSRYPPDGDLHGLIFSMSLDELNRISTDDQATVRYSPSNGHDVWSLSGSIDQNLASGC